MTNEIKQKIKNYLELELSNASVSPEKLRIGALVSHLGISKRTIQRKLELGTTTFSDILDDVRKSRSKKLLHNKSVCETSVALGYRERTGFTEAFKRWYKMPPQDYKKLYNMYMSVDSVDSTENKKA